MIGKFQIARFLRMDSHKKSTLDKIEKILDGRQIDVLFIDGDNSYEGVKADFEAYFHLVRPCGLVVMHDIVENGMDPTISVPRYWKEVGEKFENHEIISKNRNKKFEIGFIINN